MLAGIWSSADRDSESHIPRAFYGQRHTCFYLFHFLQHGMKKIDNCFEIYPYIIPFESIALSCLFEAFLVGMILINTKSSALDFD